MAQVVRLKNYRNYMLDGFGYAEFKHADKNKVFVAVIVGDEPKKVTVESQFFDVDAAILQMAANIKAAIKAEKEAAKKNGVKLAPKKKSTKKKTVRPKTK